MKKSTTTLLAFLISAMPFVLTGCGDAPSGSSSQSQYVELSNPPQADSSEPGTAPQAPTVEGQVSDTLNLEFVLDGSGSMAGQPIEDAKAAIHACIDALPKDKTINLGLVVFDGGGIREAIALGSDQSTNRQYFLQQVDAVEAGGGTPLADAMNVATAAMQKQFERQCRYGNFRQIIVTDGQPDWGQNLDAACSNAVASHATLYTIGFGIGDDHPLKAWALSYQTADSASALTAKLKEATAEPKLDDPMFNK